MGCGARGASIAGNHGHALMIPMADVTAGQEKTYSIQGSSGHDHQLTVSAANMAILAGGGSVDIRAEDSFAHSHICTVSCA